MAKIKPLVKARSKKVAKPSVFYGADRSFIYAKTHHNTTQLPKPDHSIPVLAPETTWKAGKKKETAAEKVPLPIAVQELPLPSEDFKNEKESGIQQFYIPDVQHIN